MFCSKFYVQIDGQINREKIKIKAYFKNIVNFELKNLIIYLLIA